MDIFDVFKRRRSVREFENKKVETEKVEKILEAAFYSSSSHKGRDKGGENPLEWVLIIDFSPLPHLLIHFPCEHNLSIGEDIINPLYSRVLRCIF